MPIAALDNRTSRRRITYQIGRAPRSANVVDILNQTVSGVSAYTTVGTGFSTNTQGETGFSINTQGETGFSTNTQAGTITYLGTSGLGGDVANPVIAGGFKYVIGQPASSVLAVSAGPSIRVEVPVNSDADDPPKAVSNDDISRALDAARTRGRALVAELLRGQDMLTTEEFRKLIRVTRHTLNEKRKRREILALEGAGQGPRFPKWQIGKDGKPFRALPQLFDRLGGNPWTVYRFLVQHHPELNGLTGVEVLQRGQTNQVLDAAESTLTAAS
jgi:hypothetical protein